MNRVLTNYDEDGSENITKQMNLRPFKLCRVYLDPLNSSNVRDVSWSWILKALSMFNLRKENSSSCVHVLHKMSHWKVSRRSRALDVKEMY